MLVHGIWNTGRMFDPLAAALRREGYTCFAPDLQPNDCRSGVRDLTHKLSAQIDAHFGSKAPLVLVGFSLGGLVARDYVQNVVADRQRVRGVFLIASSAKGTLWANLSPQTGQRQMAIGSRFLRGLNAASDASPEVPLHAYWTPLDLMVVPASNARWPEGKSTRIFCPVLTSARHPLTTHLTTPESSKLFMLQRFSEPLKSVRSGGGWRPPGALGFVCGAAALLSFQWF